jgi:Protein of unknown function (DUF3379)
MMDHQAYRRALLADPRSDSAERADSAGLREHGEACAECRAYRERLLRFESRLERALQLDMREPARGSGPKRFALAASALLALVVAGAVWLAVPRATLAAAVVAHVMDEPQSWTSQAQVADPRLALVLREAHMRLRADAGAVSYASSCEFRGHVVPHLVVQSAAGPATVMVLVHENAAKQVQFAESGYRGVIVPVAGHGSIALLMRSSDAQMNDVEEVAARVSQAIVWEP